MLSLETLAEVQETLTDGPVITAYIDALEADPSERATWRRKLTYGLDEIANSLSGDERSSFDAARALLVAELEAYPGFLPGQGWAAFVTPDRVALCREVPARMPNLVRWRDGAVLGPLLRALKQNRPVVTVLIDSRRARVLSYVRGELSEDTSYRADTYIDDLTDVTTSGRGGTSSGVRGETASDAADRIQREEMERLVRTVVGALREKVDQDTILLLGGSPVAETTLQKQVQSLAEDRVVLDTSLHVGMTPAQLKSVVERTASEVSEQRQAALVREVIEAAGSHGRGVVHAHTTERACRVGQVATLVLSPNFVRTHEDQAEEMIALTLAHSGAVELVGEGAGTLLDSKGGGVGARLRYVPSSKLETVT